jgi:hypothetical protein
LLASIVSFFLFTSSDGPQHQRMGGGEGTATVQIVGDAKGLSFFST